jgi:transcription elongation factor GreA
MVRTIPRDPRGYHRSMTTDPAATGAANLLRSVGLLADGPGQWGRPVSAQGPGVFIVELSAPLPSAPIELSKVGKWIERVETLRLDGARPTSKALAARLGAFWLPSQAVLYIGTSEASVGRRVAAMARTELGDRRPYAGAHWLKTLRSLDSVHIWWSATAATEEYEDALFDAFAASVTEPDRAGLHDRQVVLPFANLRRADGQRKATGLTGPLLTEPVEAPPPATHVVQLSDGDAEGARGEAPERRRARPLAASRGRPTPGPTGTGAAVTQGAPIDAGAEAVTPEGSARLRAELDHLTTIRRPEVIARIRTAKEHGDLKENSEYHAAREEQSFLEGRIQALEARLRTAVIVDAPVSGARVGLGSRVTIEADGETVTYTIVGASESDPTAGRISSSSPVGRALVGRDAGDSFVVRTPAGERHYRIIEID